MSRTVKKNGQVYYEWLTKDGSTIFMSDAGGVFREDAQGNMVAETAQESYSAASGLVQESGAPLSSAERLKRRHENRGAYAALGFSDQEAQTAAGLDRAQGPEAAYALLGLSREEAKAAAEIKAEER